MQRRHNILPPQPGLLQPRINARHVFREPRGLFNGQKINKNGKKHPKMAVLARIRAKKYRIRKRQVRFGWQNIKKKIQKSAGNRLKSEGERMKSEKN
jgi:hypothetical protein